jgi:hypothetical protein
VWPDNADWNAEQPVMVLYRDPDMSHVNFTGAGRYFFEEHVWDFFHAHPRLAIP